MNLFLIYNSIHLTFIIRTGQTAVIIICYCFNPRITTIILHNYSTPESAAVAPQDDEPVDRTTEEPATPNVNDPSNDADTVSPGDTAEIDVAAVEAKLKDPGSTMSFEPLTDERVETDSTYDAGTTTQLMWGARSDVGCVARITKTPIWCNRRSFAYATAWAATPPVR